MSLGPHKIAAFKNIKEKRTQSPALPLNDSDRKTAMSADASSCGLGAVLRQTQPEEDLKPVAYASGSLSPIECRYAQVKK